MLRGLRGSVRGVRFRTNRREIDFFAPARESRLRAVMDWVKSGAARCGDHRAAKFVKFVHFRSAISSNLPRYVSDSGRWRVRGQQSCCNLANWDICPLCLGVGKSRLQRQRSAVRARAADILGNSAPRQMRPPYTAHGPPAGDAPSFVRADRRSVLQRNGTPKNTLKCGISIASGSRGKHPSPFAMAW
jgi:hypothetical protein